MTCKICNYLTLNFPVQIISERAVGQTTDRVASCLSLTADKTTPVAPSPYPPTSERRVITMIATRLCTSDRGRERIVRMTTVKGLTNDQQEALKEKLEKLL
ncbi:hypothetical protein CBL_01571 [Carabus blaptoides fortunei]